MSELTVEKLLRAKLMLELNQSPDYDIEALTFQHLKANVDLMRACAVAQMRLANQHCFFRPAYV